MPVLAETSEIERGHVTHHCVIGVCSRMGCKVELQLFAFVGDVACKYTFTRYLAQIEL